ncbi:MAG: DUF4349 domain-containing protein [Actinomycetota bacterium]
MNDSIESEIRQALDAKAHEVEVPADLAARTLQAAAERSRSSLRERLRVLRDSQRMRAPATGYPRWMYSGAALGTAILLFAVGTLVTRDPSTPIATSSGEIEAQSDAPIQEETALSDDASGRSSQSGKDVDAEPGDSSLVAPGGDLPNQRQSAEEVAQVPPATRPGPGNIPPKVVRTAEIEVEVRSFDSAWNGANSIAGKHDGFVTNSSTEQVRDERGRGTLTMRVPAPKLQGALRDLRELGTLAHQRTRGEDVSSTLVDLAARIKSLEAEELQVIELLNRTTRISEVLEIRNRLDNVRQEIESLKAQEKVYKDQVDYATINATIFEQGAAPDDDPNDGILADAWDTALEIGLTIVAGTVVVLGGLIPLAALGLAIWFAVRAIRRRRNAPAE